MFRLKIFIVLLFISTLSFSQNFSRAYRFYGAEKSDSCNTENVNVFIDSIDILIEQTENDISIYSDEIYHYTLVGQTQWKAFQRNVVVDRLGNFCYYYIGYSRKYNIVFHVIEYPNYLWMFLVKGQEY